MPTITTTVVAKQPSSSFLRGEHVLQSLLEQMGIQINNEQFEQCAKRINASDCHAATDTHSEKCVYCPNNISGGATSPSSSRRDQEDHSLMDTENEMEGVCLPAAVFALACPKSSRSLLSKRV
eukprot:scaffold191041_cov23-Cyclotella_meneghiniana.AAC.1